jgi:hypothetical protein
MRMKFVALAGVALLVGQTQVAPAAPIQAVLDPSTGTMYVGGLTGEIYISLRGPDEILNRPGARPIAGAILDNFVPGEVTYLNLGGFNGNVSMGPAARTDAYYSLEEYRFAWQLNFTSEIVEMTPSFATPGFVPPVGQAGFWVISAPEPAAMTMAGMGLVGMVAFARRRSRPLPASA